MSREQFDLLPCEIGWKQEYSDGVAHISPRMAIAYTSLPTQTPEISSVLTDIVLRPVLESYEPELMRCFQEAFADAFEYCDQTISQVKASAKQCLRHFFQGPFHRWLPASRIALVPANAPQAGTIAGAALVISQTRDKDWALLDMLYVSPAVQRKGLATALVASALNELHASGWRRLVSRYQLGNKPSQAWHRRFGFVEEPDLGVAQLRLNAAEHDLWRRRQAGLLDRGEEEQLVQQCNHWAQEVERLQRALAQGKRADAFAWQRFSPVASD